MHANFNEAASAHVSQDEDGVVREVWHEAPVPSTASTAQLAAEQYLARHAGLLGLAPAELTNLAAESEAAPVDAAGEFRLLSEKAQFDSTTVAYEQTHFGLPVWEAGVAVYMKNGPYRVVGAQSTRHADVDGVRLPSKAKLAKFDAPTAKAVAALLGLSATAKGYDAKSLAVEGVELVIYRYEAAKREPHGGGGASLTGEDAGAGPTLPLPPLPKSIVEGGHYVAAVVHFQLGTAQSPDLHWRAIFDVETGAVLHLRAFDGGVNGMVFGVDPITSAPSGPLPNTANAALNPKRTSVLLQGLNPPVGGTQGLQGNLVTVADVELPTVPPPTQAVGSDFNYNARSNDFAAVNAYYHCDRFFRLVQGMGFPLATYFGPTPFPSPVDHRGSAFAANGVEINAHCLGMAGGVGVLRTTFMLADLGDTQNPIGLACDWRIVLHELGGHGILYPHVHSANFGFAHSAGDSIAVILNDPETAAPDRFLTFPWVGGVISRRHDRPVAGGWGWNGNIALNPFDRALDGGGYNNEQILSTSHFRLYRSIGGDSPHLGSRQFAARFACYLILRAVASLTPATNPTTADGYVTALLAADLGDWTSEGHAGGAYGKVVRWAFERQGLFQPAGTPMPNNNEGAPPPVDVYIDDGRAGEYPFQANHWSCQAIWNRLAADGLAGHQEPVVGVTNFAYVKVKNRGTQTATGVVVKAFHANPAAGLVYPNDWQAMTTAQLAAANVPPNSATEILVGPFQWVPTHLGHECMFVVVSAAGDPSNADNIGPGESIPEWRLVPHDNNIGQRNVFPVAAGNLKNLVAAVSRLTFTLKNPHPKPARMVLVPILPRLLVERDWKLDFGNPGGGAFKLLPGETKTIALRLTPGKMFTAAEIAKAKDAVIHVEAYADDILVGGMSYTLDAKLKPSKPK